MSTLRAGQSNLREGMEAGGLVHELGYGVAVTLRCKHHNLSKSQKFPGMQVITAKLKQLAQLSFGETL